MVIVIGKVTVLGIVLDNLYLVLAQETSSVPNELSIHVDTLEIRLGHGSRLVPDPVRCLLDQNGHLFPCQDPTIGHMEPLAFRHLLQLFSGANSSSTINCDSSLIAAGQN